MNQQIVSVEYELIEEDLNTPTSRRTIDLDERTVAVMRRHRRQQIEDQLANGVRVNDGYVFARNDGSPIHPDFTSQTFERLTAQSLLPRIRLHDYADLRVMPTSAPVWSVMPGHRGSPPSTQSA